MIGTAAHWHDAMAHHDQVTIHERRSDQQQARQCTDAGGRHRPWLVARQSKELTERHGGGTAREGAPAAAQDGDLAAELGLRRGVLAPAQHLDCHRLHAAQHRLVHLQRVASDAELTALESDDGTSVP